MTVIDKSLGTLLTRSSRRAHEMIVQAGGLIFVAMGLLAYGKTASAQSSPGRVIQQVALADFRSLTLGAQRRVVLDPAPIPKVWDAGSSRQQADDRSALARTSDELRALADALGGNVALESDLGTCQGGRSTMPCTMPPMDVEIVAIAEPQVAGDAATVLIGIRAAYLAPVRGAHPAMGGSTYLLTLSKASGRWKVVERKVIARS